MKQLCMAIVAMAAMSACGDDNKEQPTPQPGEGGKFEGIVFATSIPNADGSSGAAYLQGIPKLLPIP